MSQGVYYREKETALHNLAVYLTWNTYQPSPALRLHPSTLASGTVGANHHHFSHGGFL
ncbi:hypothetical protein [Bartonella sp. ML70XJBT.G]|uniref:hypothetical protein n=1 Tax=Bartonella sp. ML70XJBT.G TaxID=3019093 RepID=UPI003857B943